MEVRNHDIVGLVNRIQRFLVELTKSVSADVSQFNAFDTGRLKSYLDAIEKYRQWMTAQPQLDLPETAPRGYAIPDFESTSRVENESINDTVRLLKIMRDELVNSQSARQPAGLTAFDDFRLSAILTKLNEFISSYIEEVTPLDLPESSPMQPSSGAGNTGI